MAAVAEAHGHRVDTLDLCFAPSPQAAIAEKLHAVDPDVIGISLRNLDSTSYPDNTSYIDDYCEVVAAIRASSAAPVVLGGAGFTVAPRPIMETLGAEVGVVGEGEAAFPWVLERLANRESLSGDGQVACEAAGRGVLVVPHRIQHLDAAGVPSRRHFDWQVYYERGGALNVQTKRGCYF